jgi:hemerythrin-like metal-binding protein
MNKLVWNDQLLTGVEMIDKKHKGIFEIFDQVKDSYLNNNFDKLDEHISFLYEYVNEHFKEEEEYMINNNYSKVKEHMIAHAEYKNNVLDVLEEFKSTNDVNIIYLRLNVALLDLLIDHIYRYDLLMIAELKN